MPKQDFYSVLGVSKSATADEIKSAYRKLARKFHPDATKNDPKLTEKFKEVQEAYDVLGDAIKRKNYDEFGHADPRVQAAAGRGGAADPFESFRRSQQGRRGNGRRSWSGGPGVSVEEFETGGESGDYSSIFESLFGGASRAGRGGRSRGNTPPPRGEDVQYPVTLTFEQAARGTNLPLQINRDGRLETIDVKIPPGVKDASRIRIKGRGQQTGGEPGDLFIITSVQPHAYFRREGLDIQLDLPVSLYEALLGTKVEVPTLDGRVTLTVPPGTGGGAKLRIKGAGVHRGEERGDQFVIVKVLVPKTLDSEDKEAIAKLQTKHPIDARADVPWK